jgi:hypothetical protein
VPNSTLPERPAKPREDFPLFPHRNGRWAKKVKFEYFGKWSDDPEGDAALKLWADNKNRLLAGRAMKQEPSRGRRSSSCVIPFSRPRSAFGPIVSCRRGRLLTTTRATNTSQGYSAKPLL